MKVEYPSFSLNFCALPKELSDLRKSKAVVLPVPYDHTSTYGTGSRFGPMRILEASRQLEYYDEELKVETCEIGIHTMPFVEPVAEGPESMVRRVEEITDGILEQRKFPVMLGGDHILSVGVVRSLVKRYPDLWCIQLDAHADLRDSYEGSAYSHACTAKRIAELCPVWQLGVRSISSEEITEPTTHQVITVYAHDFFISCAWQSDIENIVGENVYITVDADVFDPSCMPAVGTPEPGGLSWHDVLRVLKFIFERKNVVGFDIVEFAPIDGQHAWEFTLAKLAYKALGYKFFLGGRDRDAA